MAALDALTTAEALSAFGQLCAFVCFVCLFVRLFVCLFVCLFVGGPVHRVVGLVRDIGAATGLRVGPAPLIGTALTAATSAPRLGPPLSG
jgi:hypothetical protein